MIKKALRFFILLLPCLAVHYGFCQSAGMQMIFPVPSSVEIKQGSFTIDTATFISGVNSKNKQEDFLGRLLFTELTDKYGLAVKTKTATGISDKGKHILIGTLENAAIRAYCEQNGFLSSLKALGDEGYILSVTENKIVVAANKINGALWGLSSLRQLVQKENGALVIPQLLVKDAPVYPFRGIKLYLPGKENIQFFKRFIKDFVVLYKFNKIILELNANMRLDKHPELNIGAVEFAKHLKYSRLDRPPGVHMEYQNSSHQDNGDGQILEKEEVADLVNYIRKFGIEVIPELPSLTHSYYLLAGHEELAENLNQPYPDTYCPLKPESYKIYFDVLDEFINVIKPAMIHVGHDEWRMEKDICELCKGKDYGKLFADDLKKIHGYLAAKGIKTAIWGDHLLESVTQKDHQTWKSSIGYTYKIPGALSPEQVLKLIPKDILIFNWFWNDTNNDKQVAAFGFKQVYGNLRADINNWNDRNSIKGVLGGAPSSWAGTTPLNFGKDQLIDFLGSANLLWSKHYLPIDKLTFTTEPFIAGIYSNLVGKNLPADDGAVVTPLVLSPYFNAASANEKNGLSNAKFITGEIKPGNKKFALASTDKNMIIADNNGSVSGIKVNKDASSVIFLHACTKEALNNKGYGAIYNFDDTAEPLGWYEIVYEDGIVLTIPIRYGVNILDWGWRKRILANEKEKGKYSQSRYAWQASAVDCSNDPANPVTFFSFEWENARYGKKIKEINLKPVEAAKGNENTIILLAVSMTEKKEAKKAEGTEAQ
ncbi:MAG TPA: glycoside hydrolase family 20 zincin-like fold domain-containing protein [Chitinophagaceae bacterium]